MEPTTTDSVVIEMNPASTATPLTDGARSQEAAATLTHTTSGVRRLRLEWRDVTLVAKSKKGLITPTFEEKTILKEVNGVANPGELLAIMGPSGGGKTSLLNSLSRRQAITSGKILLNGKKLPSNFNKITAYVMQDDRLFEVLTPRELFQFSANLRLPRDMSEEDKKKRVEDVIVRLRMTACADTRVGGALMRGLSGGERKRASIGYELITNPSMLFLDEPTSGLDSFTSLALIQNLKELAEEGHTIICTIHQPSSEIFRKFDKLNLLVKGKVAYFGPAADSIDFFAKLGHPCPTYTNPTDFFMELLQTTGEADLARTAKFVEASKATVTKPALLADDSTFVETIDKSKKVETFKRASAWTQIYELTKRGWQVIVRNPVSFQARLAQNIFIGLLVGLVYLQLETNQAGVRDRQGALFFLTTSQIMSSLMGVLLTFPLERSLLIREQSNGMYSVINYYLGKLVSGLPLDVFFSIIFSLVVYWMVGLNTTGAAPFFMFLLTTFSLALVSGSFGLLLGCMLPNAEVAVSIAPIAIIPFMLFGGFFATLNGIGEWLSWIQYISMFNWGFKAYVTNEFNGLTFHCDDDEYIQVPTPTGPIQVCPITEGSQVLDSLDLSYSNDYWMSIGILLGIFVFLRLLALLFLVFQTQRSLKKTQT